MNSVKMCQLIEIWDFMSTYHSVTRCIALAVLTDYLTSYMPTCCLLINGDKPSHVVTRGDATVHASFALTMTMNSYMLNNSDYVMSFRVFIGMQHVLLTSINLFME